MFKPTMRLLAVALLFAVPQAALAQTPPPPAQPAAAPAQQLLTTGQLDALVAPIALYPDALLSLVLMASTYPLEVVQADRWVGANKNSSGRCVQGGTRPTELGRQREVAHRHARRARHDEQQARLDAAARRRGAGTAARRHGRHPAAAHQGASQQQAHLDQSADSDDATAGRPAVYLHRADRPGRALRALLRSVGRLWCRGPIRTIRHITGRRRPISASEFSRPGWRSAPAMRSGVGPRAAIAGAAASTGAAETSTSGARSTATIVNGNNWTHNPAHRGNVGYSNPGVAAKFGGNNAGAAIS